MLFFPEVNIFEATEIYVQFDRQNTKSLIWKLIPENVIIIHQIPNLEASDN